jgi:predicted transcriptional regulator
MADLQLGQRELDVMNVLWDHGSGTVADVRAALPADLAYTTVLTILRNLEEKGLVAHETEGRAHRYFPTVSRQKAQSSAVSRLMSTLFSGSAEELLVHLVGARKLSAEQLERVQRMLEQDDAGDDDEEEA